MRWLSELVEVLRMRELGVWCVLRRLQRARVAVVAGAVVAAAAAAGAATAAAAASFVEAAVGAHGRGAIGRVELDGFEAHGLVMMLLMMMLMMMMMRRPLLMRRRGCCSRGWNCARGARADADAGAGDQSLRFRCVFSSSSSSSCSGLMVQWVIRLIDVRCGCLDVPDEVGEVNEVLFSEVHLDVVVSRPGHDPGRERHRRRRGQPLPVRHGYLLVCLPVYDEDAGGDLADEVDVRVDVEPASGSLRGLDDAQCRQDARVDHHAATPTRGGEVDGGARADRLAVGDDAQALGRIRAHQVVVGSFGIGQRVRHARTASCGAQTVARVIVREHIDA